MFILSKFSKIEGEGVFHYYKILSCSYEFFKTWGLLKNFSFQNSLQLGTKEYSCSYMPTGEGSALYF